MSVTITKLVDGERNKVFHVFIDGTGTDLADEVLVDTGELLTFEGVTWTLDGFVGILKFEYLVDDTLVWVLPRDAGPTVCFRDFGGLKDRSPALDATGRVLLDTIGIGSQKGSLILK